MKHVSDIASAMTQIFESDEHKSLFGLPYKTAQTVQRHNQVDPSSNCDGAMARGECLKCHKTVDSNKADDCSVEETSDKDSNKFAKINVFYKLANDKDLDKYIKTEEEAGKRLHRDPRYQTILEKLDEENIYKQKYNDLLPSNIERIKDVLTSIQKKPSSFKDIDYPPFEYEETNLEDFNFAEDCSVEESKTSSAFNVAIDSLLTASAALDAVGFNKSSALSLRLASFVVDAAKKKTKKDEKKDDKKKGKEEPKKGKKPFPPPSSKKPASSKSSSSKKEEASKKK